jgi:endonuclease YncB( thermonuclease family)
MQRGGPGVLLGLLLAALPCAAWPETLHSYALINDDASLVVQNRVVHLAGVYVPTTRTSCIDAPRPGCRTRAAAALEFRIQGFVQCDILGRRSDGSRFGVCYVGRSSFDPGVDLGAYLIERGWALAGEGAPYEYRAVEDLARAQSAGIWGNARIWTPRGYR